MAGTAQRDRAEHDPSGDLRDPTLPAGISSFADIQTVAPSVGVDVSPINVRDAGEIERAISAFARSEWGLIVTTSAGRFFI